MTCAATGYGYADQPLSSLENVRIENAAYGIVFEDLCAPTLKGVTFEVALAVPSGTAGTYVVEVFDVRGRRVWWSRRELGQPGRYSIEWSGRDSSDRTVAAGMYFLRVSGPQGFVQIRKLAVLR